MKTGSYDHPLLSFSMQACLQDEREGSMVKLDPVLASAVLAPKVANGQVIRFEYSSHDSTLF